MNNKRMSYEEAMDILRQYSICRKGDHAHQEMIGPKVLAEAIELIVMKAKIERSIKDRRKAHAIKR